MSFNRSRGMFHCEPNCPRRKPGCQDHCKQHQDAKTLHEARKKEYYGDAQVQQYMTERSVKARDIYVKNQKHSKAARWTKD